MEKKQVGLETAVNVSGRTLVVVAQTSIYTWQNNNYPVFFGFKKPLYLLVQEMAGKTTFFDMDGKEVMREVILTRYPDLKYCLSKYLP
jgi:hypothetical protein